MRQPIRDLGFALGELPTGPHNHLADVPGVRVGHVTLGDAASGICTGVTAILPHGGSLYRQKVAAAYHVVNGYGKTTGLVQVGELGEIESPIMLTNTLSVPAVTEGTLRLMLAEEPEIADDGPSVNVVVGECNDSRLSDMRGLHVRPQHAEQAIKAARAAVDFGEGAVGAGHGMICFGWKGGIGSSSRFLSPWDAHVGVMVLANFGSPRDLTVLGVPVGHNLMPPDLDAVPADGSIMMVIGTDLPVDARQLGRLARRASFGLARTGSIAHHGSGDIVIAFAAEQRPSGRIEDPDLSMAFRAVSEATEEAILNALFCAETRVGRKGRRCEALPTQAVIELLRRHGIG